MRHTGLALSPLLLFAAMAGAVHAQDQKNIPAPDALRQRALATAERTADQRERYECREKQIQNDVDPKGRIKKTIVIEQDFFFVHSRPVLREITHDGRPLSAADAKKQDDRVRKEIEDAEKDFKKQKKGDGGPFSSRNFIKMATLRNERRVLVSGRPTIVFDVVDNPEGKGDMTQRIVAAMRGTISIDEQTGQVQDLNVTGVRDVKLGGGLLANVHKGFLLHTVFAPESDGVWMLKTLYGSGDARVGLFFHPAANFRTDVLGCKLYNVESDQTVKEVEKEVEGKP